MLLRLRGPLKYSSWATLAMQGLLAAAQPCKHVPKKLLPRQFGAYVNVVGSSKHCVIFTLSSACCSFRVGSVLDHKSLQRETARLGGGC